MKSKYYEPSGADVYLKYVCPNGDCLDIQWLTLKESKTKNYKIVCDCCGKVYKPKRVKTFSVQYYEDIRTEKTKPTIKAQETKPDLRFLEEAKKTLISFGFDKDEASDMISNEYEKSKWTNPATLVKNSLDFFGVKNG